MTETGHHKLFGAYVSAPVYEELADHLYAEAGVVDFESYFDETAATVPPDDPGAEVTHALLEDVVEHFAVLYDDADFEAAERVDPDAFVLVHLAAAPKTVANARERFQAAATIRETDLRTVHTAILSAHLSRLEAGSSPEPDEYADADRHDAGR